MPGLTAIPLCVNGYFYRYASAENYVTNGGATPYDAASPRFTPPSQDDYYILARAIVGQQEWMGYIASEDNSSIVVNVHSDDTAGTGWKRDSGLHLPAMVF